ncbi:MAG: DNA/RNA nuclease SfsA [Planctomycetota bacterium]|nr:DNA/RNA nuclease SfsA [Planctomycetota bacterium]
MLIRRYKRFLADVRREGGSELTVHCANPGSMSTCSSPGSRVRIRDAGNPKRKLSHDLEQIRAGRAWVCVNTAVPNRVVGAALRAGRIPGLDGYETVRAEVPDGDGSRFDFLLSSGGSRCWVEVKNVTLKRGREARFPDAVTERGLKHLQALERHVGAGDRAVMLYFVGRADVSSFRPAWEVDPAYAEGLERAAAAGVEVLPIRAVVTPVGVGVGLLLPYHLGHV